MIAARLLSQAFFEPITKLREAMRKVADGELNTVLETKSTCVEIQELYAGFNLMTQELSSTEVLQSDFVSSVSHEIKTPINAIEGYTTLLQGTENIDEVENEYIERILFNTRRLSEMVSNILLLSKLENQTIAAPRAPFRLDEQIRQSILALETKWTEKDLEFDVVMDEITYLGNENLMRHVWDNLIGNAIKFSPEKRESPFACIKKRNKFCLPWRTKALDFRRMCATACLINFIRRTAPINRRAMDWGLRWSSAFWRSAKGLSPQKTRRKEGAGLRLCWRRPDSM